MKKHLSILLVLSLVLSLAACGGSKSEAPAPAADAPAASDSSEPIVIGSISPNTGGLAAYGIGITTGIELAVEEINAAGGILGRQVKVITTDDQGDPTECLNAFNSLVAQGVGLVIGCGRLSASTVEGAKNAGGDTRHFADKAALIAALPEIIQPGDSVLVKASHSMAFEDVVAVLEKM